MRQAAARGSTCSLARARRSEWADGDSAETVRMWPEQPHIWAQCRNPRPWPAGDQPGTQDAEDTPVSRAGDSDGRGLDLPWGAPASGAPACPCPAPYGPGSSATASIRTRGREELGYRSGLWGVYASPSLGLFRTIARRPAPLSLGPSQAGRAPSLAPCLHGKIGSP